MKNINRSFMSEGTKQSSIRIRHGIANWSNKEFEEAEMEIYLDEINY